MQYRVKSGEFTHGQYRFGALLQNLGLLVGLLLCVAILVVYEGKHAVPGEVVQKLAMLTGGLLFVAVFGKTVFALIMRKHNKAIEIVNREVCYLSSNERLDEEIKVKLMGLAKDIGTLDHLRDSSMGKKGSAKRRFRDLHWAAKQLSIVPEDEPWGGYFDDKNALD